MTYIFNMILCDSVMYVFLHFLLSVLLKLLKHVKVINFENYKISVPDKKKVVTRFDKKKNSDMAEKEHWWREESINADPEVEDPLRTQK